MLTNARGTVVVTGLVVVALAALGAWWRFASPAAPRVGAPEVPAARPSAAVHETADPAPSAQEPLTPPAAPAGTHEREDVGTRDEPEFGEDGDAPAIRTPPCEVESAFAPDAGSSGAVDTARIAGAIRGVLVRESGPWTDETLPRGNTVILDLVDLKTPHESRRGTLTPVPAGNDGYTLEFAFEDLPEGEYELTLSALGSVRWSPTSMRVRPPANGLVFTRYDRDPRLPLAFEVRDARTDAEIAAYQVRHVQLTPSADAGVFLQTGPLDVDAFPLDARFAWTLWADGYAAAFGDETAFERRGERRVARVRLEPGWSTRVLVLAKDPLARPVSGAEVLLDGRFAGTTDTHGMVAVRASARPASLGVRLDGWSVVGDPLAPLFGKTAEQRAHTTIVYLAR